MRWWLLLFILWASPALAQWVEFTPCGLKLVEEEEEERVSQAFKGPAPNLLSYTVWVPYVVSVIEIKPVARDKVICSEIITVKGNRYVLGTKNEVLKKLGKK